MFFSSPKSVVHIYSFSPYFKSIIFNSFISIIILLVALEYL